MLTVADIRAALGSGARRDLGIEHGGPVPWRRDGAPSDAGRLARRSGRHVILGLLALTAVACGSEPADPPPQAEDTICSGKTGSCTLTDSTLDALSPRQIAQIWIEATGNMTGAHAPGGSESCVSAVSIALMECSKVGSSIQVGWQGIDTPICSVSGSAASGIWQVTSSDSADLTTSGCASQKASCDKGDPCCNARLAYGHAKLKCTATQYDPNSCAIGAETVTDIPSCGDVSTPNMPCYDGPFCLNTQLDANNAPYGPPTPAIDQCFPGIYTCARPALDWSGWGANYDYYHNTFCCLSAQCGASASTNTNWNCFAHGQTDAAYACAATNPQGLDGQADVPGESTPTSGELAQAACAAVLGRPYPGEIAFEPCWFRPGYGADASSSCVPTEPLTDPNQGCASDQTLLCPDPWNTDPITWGCQVGAPTPGFQGLGPLCGPDAGSKRDTPWLWTTSQNSCVLRGADYSILTYTGCGNDIYAAGFDASSYLTLQQQWQSYARTQATQYNPAGWAEAAYLIDIPSPDGGSGTVQAAMALGHGVLGGLCGDCFLVRSDATLWGGATRYAVVLQADVRAWSFEISPGAQQYLFENTECTGDETSLVCCIPDVAPIDCSVVPAMRR